MQTSRDIKDALFEQVARIARAVASPRRLELVELLCQAPETVEELAREADMSIKLASSHLNGAAVGVALIASRRSRMRWVKWPRPGVVHMRRTVIIHASLLLAAMCWQSSALASTVASTPLAVGSSALPGWANHRHAFTLRLIPMSPDNVRAFYDNMGYAPAAVAEISRVCVFGTSIRNRGRSPIRYDVTSWRVVTADGKSHALISKTDWLARWKADGIEADWSILPPQQILQPGDWAQGLTTVDVPHGTPITLHYSWSEHGTQHQSTLAGAQCGSNAKS